MLIFVLNLSIPLVPIKNVYFQKLLYMIITTILHYQLVI